MAKGRAPNDWDAEHVALTAPVIFLDGMTSIGLRDGVIHATLETFVYDTEGEGSPYRKRTVVAHLRMGVEGARSMHSALSKALLALAPNPSKPS